MFWALELKKMNKAVKTVPPHKTNRGTQLVNSKWMKSIDGHVIDEVWGGGVEAGRLQLFREHSGRLWAGSLWKDEDGQGWSLADIWGRTIAESRHPRQGCTGQVCREVSRITSVQLEFSISFSHPHCSCCTKPNTATNKLLVFITWPLISFFWKYS